MTTTIKFYTEDPGVLQNFPPRPAGKIVPEWFKHVPATLSQIPEYIEQHGIGTVKKCTPVTDYITSGYIIQNTFQTVLKRTLDKEYTSFNADSASNNYIGASPYHQCPVQINGQKNHYIKIHQPWKIETPPGYSCLIYQPFYHFVDGLNILPAIVDTDTYPDSIVLVATINKSEVKLNPGDPLFCVFPFKREDWVAEASVKPFKQQSFMKFLLNKVYYGAYAKMFHSKKSYI